MVIKRKTNTATTPPSTQSNKQQKNQQPPVQPPDEDEESISTLIEPFTKEQLLTILREAAENHPDIASRVRNVADKDTVHRKIFVHGLDWGTTTDTLRDTFKEYGEIEDCKAVTDKLTGKSKGYGFILFKKRVGAKKALKEPKKRISGRIVSCQLSAVGPVASSDGPKPGKGGRGRGRGRGSDRNQRGSYDDEQGHQRMTGRHAGTQKFDRPGQWGAGNRRNTNDWSDSDNDRPLRQRRNVR